MAGRKISEEIQIFAQPQQARFRAMLIGNLVPLRAADCAENDGIRFECFRHGRICDGDAMRVKGRPADEIAIKHKFRRIALGIKKRDQALDFRHGFDANTVAGEQEQGMRGHWSPSIDWERKLKRGSANLLRGARQARRAH